MKTYGELFARLQRAPKCAGLEARVKAQVAQKMQRRVRSRLVAFGALCFVSLGALIPAIIGVIRASTKSGFGQYVSLLFSDTTTALASAKTFFFAIAESVPLVSITIALALVLVVLFAAREIAKGIRSRAIIRLA